MERLGIMGENGELQGKQRIVGDLEMMQEMEITEWRIVGVAENCGGE